MSTAEPPDATPEHDAPAPDAQSPEPEVSEPDPAQPGWAASAATTPPPAPPALAPTAPAAQPASATWPAPTAGGAPPSTPPDTAPVAAVAPEAWNAPAPKPKRKLTWLWILLGVLGLITALVVVAVVLFVRTLAGPIDATNKVLAQIKAQDYPAAYQLACSEDRDDFTVEQYAQAFRDTVAQRGDVKKYDVNYSSVHGSTAEVRYDIDFDGGDTLRLEAEAHKEHGTWRTCLLRGQS